MKFWRLAILAVVLTACTYPTETVNESTNMEKPGSSGGWSKTGQLTQNQSQFLQMQVDFGKAGPFTVQFALSFTPFSSLNNQPIRCEALVSWKTAGNTITRRITVGNGASISGVAEAIEVRVMDTSAVVIAPPGALQTYSIEISVGPGTRAGDTTPPQLQLVDANRNPTIIVAANSQAALGVPSDGGGKSLHASVANSGGAAGAIPDQGAVLRQGQGSTHILKSYDPRSSPGWIPLAVGCDRLELINNTLVDQEWSVTLGIDG